MLLETSISIVFSRIQVRSDMSKAAQRVVVIQDASKEVSSSAIGWARRGLLLKPGDKLTLLGVLHQVNNPMGYKSRADSSMFGANPKIIEEELAKKNEEYHNNEKLMKISEKYAKHEIEFEIKVVAGPSPKTVALEASKDLRATWIILDRQMKKDKKYFMENLSCGISRMKRDNNVELLRGPKTIGSNKTFTEGSQSTNVTYDEMLPGTPEEEDLFSLELSPPKCPSPSNAILDEEQGIDNGDGPPWNNSWKVTSFSKSTSSDHLMLAKTVPSSSNVNTEALSSSVNEATQPPLQLQDEEKLEVHTETVEVGSTNFISDTRDMVQPESNEIGTQDQERKWSSTNEQEFTTLGRAVWDTEEALENSICSVCNNIRPKIGWKRDFTFAELQEATNGFSQTNFLSEGGFGSVYRGNLRDDLKIAVKQLKDASLQGEKEFKAEVHVLSKARHKNVVMLLGSCSEGSQRLLVYEYVCNGSLDQHLSKQSHRPLSWTDRMKIALGAAKGLHYLHINNIIHRDMRPNNILVTHDHEPLLGDFGLARTQQGDLDHSSETRVVGTFGYLAPEYAESGKVSTKTDVYSFGVVLLELITGLRAVDKMLGENSLVGWARPLLKERKYPDLIDPRILDSHDVHQLFWMVRVAEKCLSKDPEKRLSMETVVERLTYVTDGTIVCSIIDFSPADSDSVSSIRESNGSQDDEGTTEQESLSTEVTSISSISQTSGLFSSSSSTQNFSTRSSSISTSSEKSFLSGGKNNKKEKVKSRNRFQVPYGEMLR